LRQSHRADRGGTIAQLYGEKARNRTKPRDNHRSKQRSMFTGMIIPSAWLVNKQLDLTLAFDAVRSRRDRFISSPGED
jgi:hypothetical protein